MDFSTYNLIFKVICHWLCARVRLHPKYIQLLQQTVLRLMTKLFYSTPSTKL